MQELREQIRELESDQQQGVDNSADIVACKGEIEVLKKEIQSIEEGGHTTFVKAKEMLEPKKEVSAKNRKIQFRRVKLNRKIADLEARLTEPDVSSEERQTILADLAKSKEERTTLTQEKQALKEFNHTRFMQFQKEKVGADKQDADKQDADLLEITQKIEEAETCLGQATESGDEALLGETKEKLHLLLMEKESIQNYTHDLFLQNLDRMKAKRRSDLG